jgi:transposase
VVYMTDKGSTLVELGQRRTALREELKELTARLEVAAKADLAAGKSESEVAREAGVDRMTVRKWAGKRSPDGRTLPKES